MSEVGGKMKDFKRDTWPDRIGIPAIKDSHYKLSWVKDCLTNEQSEAAEELAKAMHYLRKAVKLLEEK